MALDKVFMLIEDNADEYIGRCQGLLRQPSVSGDKEAVRKCALKVRDIIRETGAEADLIPVKGEGNPVVYGTLTNPKGNPHNRCLPDI